MGPASILAPIAKVRMLEDCFMRFYSRTGADAPGSKGELFRKAFAAKYLGKASPVSPSSVTLGKASPVSPSAHGSSVRATGRDARRNRPKPPRAAAPPPRPVGGAT